MLRKQNEDIAESFLANAGIELTPYGRVPWTKLGEHLSARQVYITGFPEELGPRVANDQVGSNYMDSIYV